MNQRFSFYHYLLKFLYLTLLKIEYFPRKFIFSTKSLENHDSVNHFSNDQICRELKQANFDALNLFEHNALNQSNYINLMELPIKISIYLI